MILNLLSGRGIGEVELIREIGRFLGNLFGRNIFLPWREEADTQTVIDEGLGLPPERRAKETLTERHPAPAGGARGRNEQQWPNPSRVR